MLRVDFTLGSSSNKLTYLVTAAQLGVSKANALQKQRSTKRATKKRQAPKVHDKAEELCHFSSDSDRNDSPELHVAPPSVPSAPDTSLDNTPILLHTTPHPHSHQIQRALLQHSHEPPLQSTTPTSDISHAFTTYPADQAASRDTTITQPKPPHISYTATLSNPAAAPVQSHLHTSCNAVMQQLSHGMHAQTAGTTRTTSSKVPHTDQSHIYDQSAPAAAAQSATIPLATTPPPVASNPAPPSSVGEQSTSRRKRSAPPAAAQSRPSRRTRVQSAPLYEVVEDAAATLRQAITKPIGKARRGKRKTIDSDEE
jgi:hypothetical protein